MSEILNLNGTSPAATAGYALGQWQKGTSPAGTDPTTGQPYYDASVQFLVGTGGTAVVKTGNYTAVLTDSVNLLAFEDASAVTLTLPSTPPSSQWTLAVQNVGAGALTISPNGLNLDGSASSLVLQQNSGVLIYTDGTNYFTERGVSPSLTNYATIVGVQEESYTYAADTGAANAYVMTLSPATTPITGSSGKFKALHANTGASTLDVNGLTAPLVKNATQPLASGDIVAQQIVGWTYDGINYQIGAVPSAT